MKKLLLIFIFVFFGTQYADAQKFGYVDVNYILKQMPEYKEAQQAISEISQGWQDEVKAMQQEVQAMYDQLKAEEVLLTEEMKAERLEEIAKKEEEVKEFQKKVFGYEGMFFLKKKELVKPIQDKVFEAVEKVARNQRLQIVFDKSGELVMIYTDPVHDYTDYVLEELGLGDKNEEIK